MTAPDGVYDLWSADGNTLMLIVGGRTERRHDLMDCPRCFSDIFLDYRRIAVSDQGLASVDGEVRCGEEGCGWFGTVVSGQVLDGITGASAQ